MRFACAGSAVGETFEAIHPHLGCAAGEVVWIRCGRSIGARSLMWSANSSRPGEQIAERLRFAGRYLEDVVVGDARCGAFVCVHVGWGAPRHSGRSGEGLCSAARALSTLKALHVVPPVVASSLAGCHHGATRPGRRALSR